LAELARVIAYANPANAVRAGENVQVVAQAWGITTPEGIRHLETIAIDSNAPTSARSAVRAGGNVQDVARERGITTPEGIRDLETIAALR
jgi:hypothetical protein